MGKKNDGGIGLTADAERYPFLSADFSRMRAKARPVNVFALSGFPRWETVASRVLAYFLDPRDERHRMGTVGVDALLTLLDGAPLATANDGIAHTFHSSDFFGSTGWVVETEAATVDGKRIDILMTNDELDIALIIENKLDAAVYNPFASYVRGVSDQYANVLTVILAPTHRSLPHEDAWISAAVTYDQLFDHMQAALAVSELAADQRSVDLLHQFIENTSEKEQRMSSTAEAIVLEEFWGATVGTDKQLGEFFKALTRVNKILKRRAELLGSMISGELTARGLLKRSWLVPGNERAWGRRDGRVAIVYVAFELISGNCIELMVGQHPCQEWSGFAVKAYADSRRPGNVYSDFDHIQPNVTWRDPDADVVAAFMQCVDDLEALHPRGL